MPALISALKNEHTKRFLRTTRIRPSAGPRGKTPHYRMPVPEAAGGYLVLGKYRGPEMPRREWEDLTYTTYATDPAHSSPRSTRAGPGGRANRLVRLFGLENRSPLDSLGRILPGLPVS